jgi:hypothetical protein
MFSSKISVNKNEKVAFRPYQGVYQFFGCSSFSHLRIRRGKSKNKGEKRGEKGRDCKQCKPKARKY